MPGERQMPVGGREQAQRIEEACGGKVEGLKPGYRTTEFWLSILSQIVGVLALFAKAPIAADEDAMIDGLSSTIAGPLFPELHGVDASLEGLRHHVLEGEPAEMGAGEDAEGGPLEGAPPLQLEHGRAQAGPSSTNDDDVVPGDLYHGLPHLRAGGMETRGGCTESQARSKGISERHCGDTRITSVHPPAG